MSPKIRHVIHSRFATGWSFTPRIPDYHTLTLINHGIVRYIVHGKEIVINRKEVILMPGGLEKTGFNHSEASGDFYSVHFFGDLPEYLTSDSGHAFRNLPFKELLTIFEHMHRHWLSGTPSDLMCCAGYLTVIRGLLPSPVSHEKQATFDRRVDKMKEHLLEHLEDKTDLEVLSEVAGVSRAYAGTLFRSATGITVQNYANALRVRKAQSLLVESEGPLKEIASQCGFEDVFYFSKIFKKHTNLSPDNYRQRYLDG